MSAKSKCYKRLAAEAVMLTQHTALKDTSDLPPASQPKKVEKFYQKKARPTNQKQPAPISIGRDKMKEDRNLQRSGQSAGTTGTSKAGPRVGTDPFVGIPEVSGLKADNFKDYLRQQDVAMVMFYQDKVPACTRLKSEFIQAAKTTDRPNHAFAAVDCFNEIGLCLSELVVFVPSFKLYSFGRLVGIFDLNIRADELKKVVEEAPLAESPDTSLSKFTITDTHKKH